MANSKNPRRREIEVHEEYEVPEEQLARLPTALFQFVSKARRQLKDMGDDGHGNLRHTTQIPVDYRVINAIYALLNEVNKARISRNKAKLRSKGMALEIVNTLKGVEQILEGKKTEPSQIYWALDAVRSLIKESGVK